MRILLQPRAVLKTRTAFQPCAGYAFLESLFAAANHLPADLPPGWERLAPAAVTRGLGTGQRTALQALFSRPVPLGMTAARLVEPGAAAGAATALVSRVASTPPEELWGQASAVLGGTGPFPGGAPAFHRSLLGVLEQHRVTFEPLAGAVQEHLEVLAAADRREWEADAHGWLLARVGSEQAAALGAVPLWLSPSPFLGPLAVALAPVSPGLPAILLYGTAEPPGRQVPARLDDLVAYHRALADPSRMHMVALLHRRPRSAGELGDDLGLAPATISHHLSRLRAVGLVSPAAEGGGPVRWRLEAGRLHEYGRLAAAGQDRARRPPRDDEPARTLAAYFREGRLVAIPRKKSKRDHVLREILRAFDAGTSYNEADVNDRLRAFHEDYARLRRELVEAGFLSREGGTYRVDEGDSTCERGSGR